MESLDKFLWPLTKRVHDTDSSLIKFLCKNVFFKLCPHHDKYMIMRILISKLLKTDNSTIFEWLEGLRSFMVWKLQYFVTDFVSDSNWMSPEIRLIWCRDTRRLNCFLIYLSGKGRWDIEIMEAYNIVFRKEFSIMVEFFFKFYYYLQKNTRILSPFQFIRLTEIITQLTTSR